MDKGPSPTCRVRTWDKKKKKNGCIMFVFSKQNLMGFLAFKKIIPVQKCPKSEKKKKKPYHIGRSLMRRNFTNMFILIKAKLHFSSLSNSLKKKKKRPNH